MGFGDGQYPRIDNIAAAAVARDGQRQDDIGIGIGSDWVIGDTERVRVGQRARSVVRPQYGAIRAGRIRHRIRSVVARLAVRARENGRLYP